MPQLDQYAPYLAAALAVTTVGLGLYAAYVHSRVAGLRQQLARMKEPDHDPAG